MNPQPRPVGDFLLQFFNQNQKSMIYYINDQDIDRITRLKILKY